MKTDRRVFLAGVPALAIAGPLLAARGRGRAVTVRGPVDAADLGTTLVHEHVLVDFVGADKVARDRYDAEDAFRVVLPHLLALKARGARTLVECTPAWLGRDPALLVRLSEASGLHIVTNTGYYGAAQDKYLPAHAFEESAERLAERWTSEWRDGIEGTGIRPGFIKTGVDPVLSAKKLGYLSGVYVTAEPQETFPDPKTGEPLPPRALDCLPPRNLGC